MQVSYASWSTSNDSDKGPALQKQVQSLQKGWRVASTVNGIDVEFVRKVRGRGCWGDASSFRDYRRDTGFSSLDLQNCHFFQREIVPEHVPCLRKTSPNSKSLLLLMGTFVDFWGQPPHKAVKNLALCVSNSPVGSA